MPSTDASSIAARQRRRWLVLLGSILAIPFAAELALRWMLFSPDPVALAVGADMRRAGLYGNADADESYWRLRARFDDATSARVAERFTPDPVVGWRNANLIDDQYVHKQERGIGRQRPILLYGASFVLAAIRNRFEEFDEHEEASVLTMGVGGYGVGQSWTLARQTLPRFVDRDPLVLLTICLSTDLPRATMGLREGAKPSYSLDESGQLVTHPFEPGTFVDAAAREPVGIPSFLWAWLSGPSSPIAPLRRAANEQHAANSSYDVRVNQALIGAFARDAEAAGVEFAILLVNGPAALAAEPRGREVEIVRFLEEKGIGYLDYRRIVRAAIGPDAPVDDIYFPPGSQGEKHPNERGQRLLAQLVARALAGHRDHSTDAVNPYLPLFADGD